jgi:hypothetical protein
MKPLLGLAAAGGLLLAVPSEARAEPTSWFSAGGGYGIMRNGHDRSNDGAGAVDIALGVGSPATHPLVVGGVFRTMAYPGLGVDIGLAVRLAMQSYCVGDWGLALDLGVGARTWGNGSYGTWPGQGALILGMPYGLQVALGADLFDVANDSPSAKGGFVALEIDLLRFTAMRSGATTKTFVNPSPVNAPSLPEPVAP